MCYLIEFLENSIYIYICMYTSLLRKEMHQQRYHSATYYLLW